MSEDGEGQQESEADRREESGEERARRPLAHPPLQARADEGADDRAWHGPHDQVPAPISPDQATTPEAPPTGRMGAPAGAGSGLSETRR